MKVDPDAAISWCVLAMMLLLLGMAAGLALGAFLK